ncbi:MAG: site-specific DNA-methyltransferase [Coprococcus sp.]
MANISQIKREKMLDFLETLKEQHKDDASLMAINQIEKELTSKKYGLVWEEHEEEVDVKMQTHIPVFTEVEDKEIVGDPDSEQYNFLLEGDNLHSLKLLEKTHKGKIDVIYIDPPYNTGGTDFRYEDSIVGKDDGFRHSKWISFMKNRLEIAHRLMNDNGIIFISIDDNELAALIMLCDEIFGSENHVETIIWKNKYGAGAKTVGFISVHEYILCYSKNPIKDLTSELNEEGQAAYKKKDEKFEVRGGYLTQPLMTTSLGDRPNLMYDIEYNGDVIHPRKQWVWSKDRLEEAIRKNEVEFSKQKDGTYSVRAKKYLIDENGDMRRGKPITIFNGPFTQDGTKEMRNHFGTEDAFKFAKPSELIRKLIAFEINGISNKNAVILDFFAGSGTTAQAVLEQNRRDHGNRKFILCTNNEEKICENVTYKRVENVIKGYQDNSGIPANLKYYKTNFVDKESEEIYDDLLEHTKEMIQLQYGVKVDNQKYIMIMDDEEMDEFEKYFNEYEHIEVVFINQDVLLTTSQEKMLQDINTKIIPDCYFDFELREVGELW